MTSTPDLTTENDIAYALFDSDGQLRPAARQVLTSCGFVPPAPVPMSERLPGPEDCDAEGRCFVWDWLATEWKFLERSVFQQGWESAYWLPHHALPVPQQEADRG
jgi:hypothetical protein